MGPRPKRVRRASPEQRADFVETSNRVRGTEATEALIAEARGFWTEMKKLGEV